jgi:hypothetical protein
VTVLLPNAELESAGQASQLAAPPLEYVPASQLRQELWSVLECLPAPHAVQLAAPPLEYVPAPQLVQLFGLFPDAPAEN